MRLRYYSTIRTMKKHSKCFFRKSFVDSHLKMFIGNNGNLITQTSVSPENGEENSIGNCLFRYIKKKNCKYSPVIITF